MRMTSLISLLENKKVTGTYVIMCEGSLNVLDVGVIIMKHVIFHHVRLCLYSFNFGRFFCEDDWFLAYTYVIGDMINTYLCSTGIFNCGSLGAFWRKLLIERAIHFYVSDIIWHSVYAIVLATDFDVLSTVHKLFASIIIKATNFNDCRKLRREFSVTSFRGMWIFCIIKRWCHTDL